jgi:dinuclear metal center YbgI/SA1388 family protein
METKPSVSRQELDAYLRTLLAIDTFSDYAPNGLQLEGRETIAKCAFAVSATAESVEQSVAANADALIVHHGLFWKFHGARPLTGTFARRVYPLVVHGVNLFAYHLPLDAHHEVGNASTIARRLGLTELLPFGDHQGSATGVQGYFDSPPSACQLQQQLRALLQHEVMLATPDGNARVRTLGIITGGANSAWKQAVTAGLDAYLTGEMSEHDWHESREAGLHMFAGGHHATERFGIQALMQYIGTQFNIETVFFDSDNPA